MYLRHRSTTRSEIANVLRFSAFALFVVPAFDAVASHQSFLRHAAPTAHCRVRGSREWLSGRASPLDSARIVVGSDTALFCYSRPRARGRSVYDSLAPYGRTWRTGANEATVLELTTPAVVAEVALPRGRYTMLTVPDPSKWLVLFYTFTVTDSTFDDPGQVLGSLHEVGRGSMPAETLPAPTETFTVSALSDQGGHAFVLEWGKHRVRMPVRFQR